MDKSKVSFKFLVPVVLFALAILGLYVLWGGRGGQVDLREMACTMDGQEADCLESNAMWQGGLAFYDSTLSVTNDTLGSLRKLLWEYWNIEFAGAGDAAVSEDAVLPLRVLQNRASGCMGLSWLAMMVAEARSIDLQTILLPGHVFLRYKDVNLEPNREGYSYTDGEYREKYKDRRWTGLEFSPLTSAQIAGLAAFDLGNLYLEKFPRKALVWYRVAEQFFPEYPGIMVNQNIAKNSI